MTGCIKSIADSRQRKKEKRKLSMCFSVSPFLDSCDDHVFFVSNRENTSALVGATSSSIGFNRSRARFFPGCSRCRPVSRTVLNHPEKLKWGIFLCVCKKFRRRQAATKRPLGKKMAETGRTCFRIRAGRNGSSGHGDDGDLDETLFSLLLFYRLPPRCPAVPADAPRH